MASSSTLPVLTNSRRGAPSEVKIRHASQVPTLPSIGGPATARGPSKVASDVGALIPLTGRRPRKTASTVYETQPWRAALDQFRESRRAEEAPTSPQKPPQLQQSLTTPQGPGSSPNAFDTSAENRHAAELRAEHALMHRNVLPSPKHRRSPSAVAGGTGTATKNASAKNYIMETMTTLRLDSNVWVEFASRTNELVSARREEAQRLAEELRPKMEASRLPIDHEAAAANRALRMQAVREHRREDAQAQVNELVAKCEETARRHDRAEMVRHQLHASKLLRKHWLLNVFLAKSTAAIVIARHVGYRRRWIRLLCLYIGRHWIRLSRRRQNIFATLRLNYFIRRNLPTVVENFRYRRSTAAAPIVQKFLRQYTHVMQFISAMRVFMKRVRTAQMISRRKRLARAVLVGALRLGWERAAAELRAERTMLIEFPDALREHIILTVIQAEQSAFSRVRHAIYSEWRRLREDHDKFLATKRSLLGNSDASSNGSTNAKHQFIERQFSSSRAFFDGQAATMFGVGGAAPSSAGSSPNLKSVQQSPIVTSRDADPANTAGAPLTAARAGPKENGAERRVKLVEPAVNNGAKLHPSQRFGANRTAATAKQETSLSATHAAVAASKHRLFSNAGTAAAAAAPPGAPPVPLQSALRRQGSMISSSSFRRSSNPGVAPSSGILPWAIDPEYLMHPPPLPGRKVLCRVSFMRDLIARARDAVYAGMRAFRQDVAKAKAAAEAVLAATTVTDDKSTASSTPPAAGQGVPAVRIHVNTKRSHTGNHVADAAAEAFIVPDAFLDPAVLRKYVDFTWVQHVVNNAPPFYNIAGR